MFCQDISELRSLQIIYTPLKFKMEPENQPLEKEIPFGNHSFQVPAVKLWRCMHILFGKPTRAPGRFPTNHLLTHPGHVWTRRHLHLENSVVQDSPEFVSGEIPGGQTTGSTGRWDENQLPWLVGGLGPSWFGFRLDPFMKGICYLEISKKIPNHRDPNHQLNTRWENKPCK